MKRLLLFLVLALSACTPSQSSIETAVSKTQAAWTPTPKPTPSPMPTATLESIWSPCLLGKSMTPDYFDKLINTRTCIYGVVTDKKDNSMGVLYNIYPLDKDIFFLVQALSKDALLVNNFTEANGVLTTAGVGDCIVIVGYPLRLDDGSPIFYAVDVRDTSQVTSELGMNSPIVQEITALCK